MTVPWAALACPMPDCTEPLFLTWNASHSLSHADISDVAGLLVPADAETTTWQVECGSGHVVLLPSDAWCGCDDPQGDGCPHGADEFDWTEENRRFRPRDMERLRQLFATMGGAR